jgi:hypothetical protein
MEIFFQPSGLVSFLSSTMPAGYMPLHLIIIA